jgi:spore germination cell wall hydrolase CwlJ-like protein
MSTRPPLPAQGRQIGVALVAVGIAFAGLCGIAGVRQALHVPSIIRAAHASPSETQPIEEPPEVEPIAFADMTPDQARAFNATVPFVTGKIPPARPFIYTGTPADRSAARTCLAAALLYEAGDDRPGEQAVAQVVLNRLRHPAFPKTVCGVVFQGSDRKTGCQFTFTCDGSLDRPPRADAWGRATQIADAALSGFVFGKVGTATHYHTDWVVAYWRATLDKLAAVHTQIFYRWPGHWGSPAAFTGQPQPFERMDPRIVALAGPEGISSNPDIAPPLPDAAPPPPRTSLTIDGVPPRALRGSIVRLKDDAAAQYVLQLDPSAYPGSFAVIGLAICGDKPDCLVMGWMSEDETPRSLPVMPPDMRSLAFVYRKSSVLGTVLLSWDCARFPRPDRAQCLPGTAR